MRTYNTTKEVLERLSVSTKKPVIVLPNAEEKLKNICEIIDEMISEHDAETYTVSVVPETLVMEINVVFMEVVIEDCVNNNFFKLTEMADIFGFSADGDYISFNMAVGNLFHILR